MFITLEGAEGSGKTTQGRLLAQRLQPLGEVLLTREPGGTRAGDLIREALLSPDTGQLAPLAELLLFGAARAQLVGELIRPALARGQIVVCVRYSDSTRAYQGAGLGIPERYVEAAIELATGGLEPDLTLYLDIRPERGLQRRLRARDDGIAGTSEGWNAIDDRDLAFHARVREGYQRAAGTYPHRILTVEADAPVEVVADAVFDAVQSRLERRKTGGAR